MQDWINYHQKGWDPLYMVWHTSQVNQIIFTHSNGGSIVFSDRIYPIQPGALCFISTQCYHYTMPEVPALYDRSKFLFTDEQLQAIHQAAKLCHFDDLFSDNAVVYALIPPESQAEVEALYHMAMEPDPLTHLTCLLRLIPWLKKYQLEKIPSPTGFIAQTLDYINRNICEELTIDTLCQAVHISKYHFCRRFKSALGMTVMDYILHTRLTLAKNRLQKETAPISQISDECGFSSISYFSRAFKSAGGLSPQQYRKLHFGSDAGKEPL